MTRAARALEIACDSGKQKLCRLNRPLETSTDDSCFLSSEVTDGLVTRRFARSYRITKKKQQQQQPCFQVYVRIQVQFFTDS